MATGVLYPTKEHTSSDFTTGVHERAEGQDVDPVAIRRQQLIDELTALGVEVPTGETPEDRANRLLEELKSMDQGDPAVAQAEADVVADETAGGVPGV